MAHERHSALRGNGQESKKHLFSRFFSKMHKRENRTALFLAGRVADRTVVLTGAMVPYTFGSSDGLFNLGSALSFVQVLPPGVYLAMNGHFFSAGEVYKDKAQGVFRAKPFGNT